MMHIPNILSAFRIVLIPFFVKTYFNGNITGAAIILIISGITDMLDGTLARRFGWITQLGKVLDPAADKLTLITVCIVLAISRKEYRLFFIVLLIKDAGMLLLGGILMKKGAVLDGAGWLGKVATAAFYVGMCVLFLFPKVSHEATLLILAIITVLEIAAAFSYLPDVKRYHKETP